MTIQQFIEKAIEGGWKPDNAERESYSGTHKYLFVAGVMLDPLAWQAVGKVEGWDKKKYDSWKFVMLSMTEALINGKTIQEFLATL